MSPIPSPGDVLVSTLLWIGVPALVLLPFAIALSIAQWIRTGAEVARISQQAARGIHGWLNRMGSRLGVRVIGMVLSQALAVASVYALFRLVYAMGIADSSGYSIADGRSFGWQELWVNLVTYSGESQLAVDATLIAIGWVLAVDIAAVFGMNLVLSILGIVRYPITWLGALAAIGIGIVGLMVLSLATWMHNPGYNIEMVSLYACWVILLIGMILGTNLSIRRAEAAFQRDAHM